MAMTRFLLACLLAGCTQYPKAQSDNTGLLQEAENKLKSGKSSVSDLLTDPHYLSIHPNSTYRNLIREYSKADILRITTANEPGKKIRVLGTVKKRDGQPVANALVYLYQTDTRGWYSAESPHVGGNSGDMNHARLFGYVRTNAEGKFELQTIKPAGYPQSDLPAHIHVHVWADGFKPFVNEFLFDDDERLVGAIREQSVRNRFLIQPPQEAPPPFEQQFSYSLLLVSE